MVKEALLPTPTLLSPCDPVATVPLNEQLAFSRWQQDIPEKYRSLDAPELIERISAAKAKLAGRLVDPRPPLPARRRDRVRRLPRRLVQAGAMAAASPQAEYIVFCGVHFMAESADILRRRIRT